MIRAQQHGFDVCLVNRLQKNQSGKVCETLRSVSGWNGSFVERRTSQKEWYGVVLVVTMKIDILALLIFYIFEYLFYLFFF